VVTGAAVVEGSARAGSAARPGSGGELPHAATTARTSGIAPHATQRLLTTS
jgi:hypothetical protein